MKSYLVDVKVPKKSCAEVPVCVESISRGFEIDFLALEVFFTKKQLLLEKTVFSSNFLPKNSRSCSGLS